MTNSYKSIIIAGTFKASSIKVAEAAKVIENSQRDINIAFVNELAKIFNLIGIDTNEVLDAAATKWNFIKFKPGLVGGHCIGVDPFYLAQKAQELGYHPEIILAGRRLNDSMGSYIATEVIKLMIKKDIKIKNSKIFQCIFRPKQNPNNPYAAVIPIFCKNFINNESPIVFGDGLTTRDFTFVENIVQANNKAFEVINLTKFEVFNVGCGDQISLNSIIDSLNKIYK